MNISIIMRFYTKRIRRLLNGEAVPAISFVFMCIQLYMNLKLKFVSLIKNSSWYKGLYIIQNIDLIDVYSSWLKYFRHGEYLMKFKRHKL